MVHEIDFAVHVWYTLDDELDETILNENNIKFLNIYMCIWQFTEVSYMAQTEHKTIIVKFLRRCLCMNLMNVMKSLVLMF